MSACLALVAFGSINAASEAGGGVSDLQQIITRFDHAAQELKGDMTAMRRQVDLLQVQVDSLVRTLSPTVTATVGPLAAGAATGDVAHDDGEQGRRLTGSASTYYIAVNAQQIHELPNGHTCSNTGFVESNPRLVRLDTSGPSLSVAPTVASSDISLASIDAKDLTVSEVQRMAAPFKIVHDSSCSNAPKLSLPLITEVANLRVSSTLTMSTGTATMNSGSFSSTLNVVGAATMSSGFFSSTLTVNGAASMNGGLSVPGTGTTTMNGGLSVGGASTMYQPLSLVGGSADLTVGRNLAVAGSLTIGSSTPALTGSMLTGLLTALTCSANTGDIASSPETWVSWAGSLFECCYHVLTKATGMQGQGLASFRLGCSWA